VGGFLLFACVCGGIGVLAKVTTIRIAARARGRDRAPGLYPGDFEYTLGDTAPASIVWLPAGGGSTVVGLVRRGSRAQLEWYYHGASAPVVAVGL
jgi:hypothetical protein